MRIAGNIEGCVLILLGVVWAIQGLNLLGGTVALSGIALPFWTNLQRRFWPGRWFWFGVAIAAADVLMPAVAIAETPGALVTKWNELNELCKVGPRDDPKADEACERRNVVEALLEKHGCRLVIYTKGPLHEEWICRHKRK